MRLEAHDGVPPSRSSSLSAIEAAFEAAGIEFIGTPDDGPGYGSEALAGQCHFVIGCGWRENDCHYGQDWATVMAAYSVADAKTNLPRLIDRALGGEQVIITATANPWPNSGLQARLSSGGASNLCRPQSREGIRQRSAPQSNC